ncbi:NAD(P)-dependent oxidoreductase [Streptomyces sp. NPDC002812]|uniref:NAD-dependent epimerase/dehydratase family protein n=1 Tax=unclassified Streptomyces TaxID=2593676 RepID=UPI00202EA525|nr:MULTISPECIES: NAD(P)-dependent oxidoreductase [unclassified Streptomyces]MCM1969773.1 NAD(P)-dependent oxidoreductase [Streptomyces sp. G1]MCX5300479.1 NAD(P)-dependent oxidoreductase [Streptomyces sp. NBC_00193]
MTRPRTLLLTGAAGGVATLLRPLLPAYGYTLRLADIRPVDGAGGPDCLTFDLRDTDAVREAVRGVDAVVHLGGISLEDGFEAVLDANIRGTYHLYEAVRAEGVRRVVFASSNHVEGFVPLTGRPLPAGAQLPVRPDTYYGLSKAFGEGLASLYADKYGVETVSVRIGSCFERPRTVRMLSTWLSPADCARLVHAALTAPDVGHTVVHGISANTRAWWDLTSARALGYAPQDDAESYAPGLLAEHGELDPDHVDARFVGGHFTRTGLAPRPSATGT